MTDAQWQAIHDAICAARDGGADEAYAAWLAVLNAIAEPSEAMLDAVENFVVGCCNAAPGDLSDIYRTMIAELRKEIE